MTLREQEVASHNDKAASREERLAKHEDKLQGRGKKAEEGAAALEAGRCQREDHERVEADRLLEHARELQALIFRSNSAIRALEGKVPELEEEVDGSCCLQVFEVVTWELEALPQALENIINMRNHLFLGEKATRIFSNARGMVPSVDLHALVALVSNEVPEDVS